MMDRNEVENVYNVDDRGLIRSPGRFELEPWWIVNVENWVEEGFGNVESTFDDSGRGRCIVTFEITEKERELFDLEEDVTVIRYSRNDFGFCSVSLFRSYPGYSDG